MPSKMRNLLAAVVKVDAELKHCQSNNKLSGEAYLAEAMRICRCDEKRLKAFHLAMDDDLNATSDIVSFINKVTPFIEDNSPCPPRPEKMGRVGSVYGKDGFAAQLALCGFGIGDAFVAAVDRAVTRRPEKFGKVGDWQQHVDHTARLVTKKDSLLTQLHDTITTADLTMDDRGATISGSDVRFRRGWPQRLLQNEIDKPRKARAKLEEAA